MAIAMLMVGGILGVVIHFTATSMETQSVSMMRTIASAPFQQGNLGKPSNDEVRLPFFTVQISSRGELITASGGYFDLTDREYLQQIVDLVLSADQESGELKEYDLRYLVTMSPMGVSIVFADTATEAATIRSMVYRLTMIDMKDLCKRIIVIVCVVAVVAALAAMPLVAKKEPEEDGPKASILSGTVNPGSIDTELIGGGTLAEDDAVAISLPSAVKLKEFLVTNGETVTEGTAIATVDRVTVMTAISQVQETLEYLSEQIQEAGDTDSEEEVTALAGGILKILYAQEGDSVQSVMLEHSALAVLSLDGLMAVDFETESTLPVGTAVTVTLSDGTAVSGKITKNLAGEMTVTVEDDAYALGDAVQVTAEDGTAIGAGELYIYSPWSATAYAGTVDSIEVAVGDSLSAGKTLMVLTDVGYSAAYRQLIAQRQEYEDLMLELFKLYQTETITAPCDGVVSGVDKDSVQLLSASGKGYTISFLSNSPNADDEILYSNYVGKVTAVAYNGWVINVNPQAIPIADYLDLTGVSMDESLMTHTVLHTQTEIPVFTLNEGVWTQVEPTTIGNGDILLFAADEQGGLVWSVLLQKAQPQPEDPAPQPDTPADPGTNTQPSTPDTPAGPGTTTNPNTSTTPDNSTTPSIPGGSSGFPSGGMTGNFPSGGIVEQEPEYELYGLEMAQIAAVTPQDTMTLDITIDELDIKGLQVGMTVQVKIDALGGEKYTAAITEIGNTGTNNGGNSKYTVELTMDRAENMLSGMNATATIVRSTARDVLTIPADALVENGNQTVVYTGYDEENDTLLNPVAVQVGSSDGKTVEILEGLTSGQTYYYAYYDTLEISFTPDFGGGGFMFG